MCLILQVSLLHTTLSMDTNKDDDETIRGLPCIKKHNQLFCVSGGSSYPSKAIDKFIDDHKALLNRMYGELQEPRTVIRVRATRTFKESTR